MTTKSLEHNKMTHYTFKRDSNNKIINAKIYFVEPNSNHESLDSQYIVNIPAEKILKMAERIKRELELEKLPEGVYGSG